MAKSIVYFLGAGCSYNFGYPLTRGIMPMIIDKLERHDLFQLYEDRKTALERRLEKELLGLLYLLYPGLKNILHKNSQDAESIPTIIDILSITEHFCFYNTPPHPKIAGNRLLHFRELLNRAIVELILDIDRKAMSKTEENLFYKLIAPVNQRNIPDKITFITTNYDLLIDWEFSRQLSQNKIDLGINYRDVSSSKIIFRNSEPRFHYYKLHGSLNWLRCDLCEQYYVNTNGSIASLAFEPGLSDYNTCVCNSSLHLKSVLVTPSIVRDIRDPNLLQIWKAALEAMRTADKIIFIGYSLPAEDLAIKSIVMRALNGRDKKNRPEIHVVQHGTDSKGNYENIFGKNIYFEPDGLAAYLDEPKSKKK
ncbi:MAG TPA: SIR2 family protein [Puia sp.]|jgi:hypothetical protein|nr:SIR2 family protein [Puia sp.]